MKRKWILRYCDLDLWPMVTTFNTVWTSAVSNHLAKTASKSEHPSGWSFVHKQTSDTNRQTEMKIKPLHDSWRCKIYLALIVFYFVLHLAFNMYDYLWHSFIFYLFFFFFSFVFEIHESSFKNCVWMLSYATLTHNCFHLRHEQKRQTSRGPTRSMPFVCRLPNSKDEDDKKCENKESY